MPHADNGEILYANSVIYRPTSLRSVIPVTHCNFMTHRVLPCMQLAVCDVHVHKVRQACSPDSSYISPQHPILSSQFTPSIPSCFFLLFNMFLFKPPCFLCFPSSSPLFFDIFPFTYLIRTVGQVVLFKRIRISSLRLPIYENVILHACRIF